MQSQKTTLPTSQRISRHVGWVLLTLHSLLALIALSAVSGHAEGSEWWPILFGFDLPASAPVFWVSRRVNNQLLLWGLFTLVGSVWHFYWPQVLVWGIRHLYARVRSNAGHS